MQQKLNTICLVSSVGILLSSFFAFASTPDGEMFVAVNHMGGMAYMIPVLGVVAVVLAILGASGKLNPRIGAITIGLVTLLLAFRVADQAKQQLDAFAAMSHDMDQRRADFERRFNSFGNTQEEPTTAPTAAPPERPQAAFAFGAYLCLLSALAQTGAGLTMRKEAKAAA